ncbi:hypothetical protein Ahy_B01g052465 [Arachis hypogaea]|uniref:Uncharacterized protein n=1 Tax=Arachis hypogaea TaxID=3818 RepID=A0A445APJ3_ARAHY|nr:hypothetical protein Ahy_B01g052465 [Arachis hypogaea]
MLLNHFVQLKFILDIEHDLMIRKIYNHRVAKQLQQMMSDVRQGRDHLTIWICPFIKKELEAHFRTDEGFKRHRLMNVANRALPRLSKYTGGSATFLKTKSKLEDYTQRLEAATQQSQLPSGNDDLGSDTSVVDPDRVWSETASEPYKNHVFALAASSTSVSVTSPANPEEVFDLMEEVQKLTQELHQQAQQYEQRYNETAAINSQMTEKLEWLDHL